MGDDDDDDNDNVDDGTVTRISRLCERVKVIDDVPRTIAVADS